MLASKTMFKREATPAEAKPYTSETTSHLLASGNPPESQGGIRDLLHQDRAENPVMWASIVLAKEILNGRGITRAKLEKVLPSEMFDGSRQNYAIDRAKRIAEKTRLTQGSFAEDLDRAINCFVGNPYLSVRYALNNPDKSV